MSPDDQPSNDQPSNDQSNTKDWSKTPAAMIAAATLGLASIAGLWWSISTPRIQTNQIRTSTPTPNSVLAPTSNPTLNPSPSAAPARLLIDLNTAGIDQLDLLPSIGPKLAQRIVDDRTKNGPYQTLKDLDRVKGIGPRTIKRIADWVTISQINSPQTP